MLRLSGMARLHESAKYGTGCLVAWLSGMARLQESAKYGLPTLGLQSCAPRWTSPHLILTSAAEVNMCRKSIGELS